MTVISDYLLPSSFFCQPFHAVPREMGAYILTFFIGCINYVALPILHASFVDLDLLCSFFFVSL